MTLLHHLCVVVTAALCLWHPQFALGQSHALDRKSTCGQTFVVYDTDLTFTARSNVAPSNPPLECIVKLQSAYEQSDGRYRLQIVIEQLQIEDCNVYLTVYNGWGITGNYIQKLGCSSSSTNIMYTADREATLFFTRPLNLYQTAYAITLTIRTYASSDDIDTIAGVSKLTTGAIVGIVCGIVAVIFLAFLLVWCVKTGYLYSFVEGAGFVSPRRQPPRYTAGSVDSNLEKVSTTSSTTALRNGINYHDPVLWSSITGDGSQRQFQRGVPRRASGRGGSTGDDSMVAIRSRAAMQGSTAPGRGNYENNGGNYQNTGQGRDSHLYEPYENETDRSPRFRKRRDDVGGSNRSRGSRRSRGSAGEGNGTEAAATSGSKETLIDEPGTGCDEDAEVKKARPNSDVFENADSDGVNRADMQGEANVDTITSPIHVNAGVRASIPDLSAEPDSQQQQQNSPRPKKRSSTSPKSRKKHKGPGGHEPDPMALPPEAFDPVFTTPTSQEQYPGEFNPLQNPAMPPMFAPYGMFPMTGMAPGGQAYAYAYQTVPPYGAYPGQAPVEGAYYVQSVPTADGDVQNTAFMMHKSKTPQRKGSKGKGGGGGGFGPGSPDFTSTPGHAQRSTEPDMSLVAAGAAPPDPGAGHRAMAMKSFADPDTGIQTTQVLWTDTVPDPTDPKPGDSSQVTRKNMTRVTTRSGHGDLPTQTSTLLDYPDPSPAFLAPSTPQHGPLPPAAITPNTTNIDYYTGGGQAPVRPPEVVHEAPSRSGKFRDRIKLGESSA